jgi:hypothetical protein
MRKAFVALNELERILDVIIAAHANNGSVPIVFQAYNGSRKNQNEEQQNQNDYVLGSVHDTLKLKHSAATRIGRSNMHTLDGCEPPSLYTQSC